MLALRLASPIPVTWPAVPSLIPWHLTQEGWWTRTWRNLKKKSYTDPLAWSTSLLFSSVFPRSHTLNKAWTSPWDSSSALCHCCSGKLSPVSPIPFLATSWQGLLLSLGRSVRCLAGGGGCLELGRLLNLKITLKFAKVIFFKVFFRNTCSWEILWKFYDDVEPIPY